MVEYHDALNVPFKMKSCHATHMVGVEDGFSSAQSEQDMSNNTSGQDKRSNAM